MYGDGYRRFDKRFEMMRRDAMNDVAAAAVTVGVLAERCATE